MAKMKMVVVGLLLAGLLGTGGAMTVKAELGKEQAPVLEKGSVSPGYRTEVKVTPSTGPHQYVVEFKIIETDKDGKTDLISAPKMLVMAGKEGQIKIGKEMEEGGVSVFYGVLCTANLKEADDGVVADTTVTISEEGSKDLGISLSVTMKK